MKTEVIMKRELFGQQISQKSKSEFFSATDLAKAGNKWRSLHDLTPFNLSQYFNKESTKEFVKSLQDRYNQQVVIKGRGRTSQTWVHPLLFIDIALNINPRLKIEVYEWLFDNLIKYRNNSGESYKKMCGALFSIYKPKHFFHQYICEVADKIKTACEVEDWNLATENQLAKRDKIHDAISLLCNVLQDSEQAVKLGINEFTRLKTY